MTYFYVTRQPGGGFVGLLSLDDIRARLAVGELQESFFATESDGRSFSQFIKSGNGKWRALGALLAEHPAVTPPAGEAGLPSPPCPPSGTAAPPSAAVYAYRVLPLSITTDAVGGDAQLAADRVGQLAAQMAAEGWDFYRIDAVVVQVRPGCLGALLGQTSAERTCHLAVFRRPRCGGGTAPNPKA
jgi:hypothetical protein